MRRLPGSGRVWRRAAPLIVLLLAGCATGPPPLIEHLPEAARSAGRLQQEITAVPFHPQADYQCGPAALATVLGWSGVQTTPEALVPRVYLPGRQGSLQPEIRATARAFNRLAYEPEPRLAALLAELDAGHPVLVLQKLGFGPWPGWHYAVVIGYDAVAEAFLLRSGTESRLRVSSRRFLTSWIRGGTWALVVLPPGTLPASADAARYQHAAADLEATGSPAAARAAWAAGVTRWPDAPAMWFGLGNTAYRQDDMAAALAAFQRAVAVAPTHAASHYNLARIHLEHGCLDQAKTHLAAAEDALDALPGLAPLVADAREALARERARPIAPICQLP
ncbi:MAG: PA2778 family cysteine peptidase [Gammaproteobacteria bacterium]|nr:PA2778 family cysteine peptidase [Gammaproteobacteria bacterium]